MTFLFVLGLAISGAVHAQEASPANSPTLSDIAARLEQGELHSREAAFDELMVRVAAEDPGNAPVVEWSYEHGTLHRRPDASGELRAREAARMNGFFSRHGAEGDRAKLGMIHLLIFENQLVLGYENDIRTGRMPPPLGPPSDNTSDAEAESEHYAGLIAAVSSLDDPRVIPALIGAMPTGGMAIEGLTKYGDKALGPLSDALKNENPLVRATALGVSVAILAKKHDAASHVRVLDLIRASLHDPDAVVRSHAVSEIDCFADRRDFVPTLQRLAATDPDHYRGRADDGVDGDEYYPVRVQARRVLRDIQANKTCAPLNSVLDFR